MLIGGDVADVLKLPAKELFTILNSETPSFPSGYSYFEIYVMAIPRFKNVSSSWLNFTFVVTVRIVAVSYGKKLQQGGKLAMKKTNQT